MSSDEDNINEVNKRTIDSFENITTIETKLYKAFLRYLYHLKFVISCGLVCKKQSSFNLHCHLHKKLTQEQVYSIIHFLSNYLLMYDEENNWINFKHKFETIINNIVIYSFKTKNNNNRNQAKRKVNIYFLDTRL